MEFLYMELKRAHALSGELCFFVPIAYRLPPPRAKNQQLRAFESPGLHARAPVFYISLHAFRPK